MMTILAEHQVTIPAIAEHILQSGLEVTYQEYDEHQPSVGLVTDIGLDFNIHLEAERQFLRFSACLPLDQAASLNSKLLLLEKCNRDLFLAAFTMDDKEDLFISYYMSYTQGIILAQLMKVTMRFSALLDHLVQHGNTDGIIRFSGGETGIDGEDHDDSSIVRQTSSSQPQVLLH